MLTVSGAPRTKKNSRVHTKTGIPLPSKAWRQWVAGAQIRLDIGEVIVTDRLGHAFTLAAGGSLGDWHRADWVPLCDPMNVRATFYRDALRGDAVGFYQGLADLLETRGIVTDDKHFVSWDGSRLELDRENPRVEVELETL